MALVYNSIANSVEKYENVAEVDSHKCECDLYYLDMESSSSECELNIRASYDERREISSNLVII